MKTGKSDHAAVEDVVRRLYGVAGFAQPKAIIWAASPLAGAYVKASVLSRGRAVEFMGSDSSWAAAGLERARSAGVSLSRRRIKPGRAGEVVDRLLKLARQRAYDEYNLTPRRASEIPAIVRHGSSRQVSSSVQNFISKGLAGASSSGGSYKLLRSLMSNLEEGLLFNKLTLSYQPHGPFWGGGPSELTEPTTQGWLAPEFEFGGEEEIGLTLRDMVPGLDEQSSSIYWLFREFAILVERPVTIRTDALGRLHCVDGAAVIYSDGFEVYSWHGSNVPKSIITGEGLNASEILGLSNVEVRRAAIERLGWGNFIAEAGMEAVGEAVSDPGNPGQMLTLYDVAGVFESSVKVLLCENATPEWDGTRHKFGITVPTNISDPVAAAAWTFGVSVSEYRKLERAT